MVSVKSLRPTLSRASRTRSGNHALSDKTLESAHVMDRTDSTKRAAVLRNAMSALGLSDRIPTSFSVGFNDQTLSGVTAGPAAFTHEVKTILTENQSSK